MSSSSVLVVLAALGCADGFGLANMISNYAKVTTNRDLATFEQTHRYVATRLADSGKNYDKNKNAYLDYRTEPNATIHLPDAAAEAAFNETDYGDFDDLEASEEAVSRRTQGDPGTMLKVVNGLVSLLALMYKFSDNRGWENGRVRKDTVAAEPRYSPNTATQKFKYQADQEKQPIGNFPPYNPLTANAADSYSQNNGQTSYEADMEQYKTKNPMSDYQKQNSYDSSYKDSTQQDGGWNSMGQDYPVYRPMKPNPDFDKWNAQSGDSDSRHPWKAAEDFPIYTHPDEKPIDYHDFLLHESPEGHHHALHLPEDEDRVSKKPYSYYYLGRKLWYIPLIFSVYFIIYVGALVLKSVAKHKIQFPAKLSELNEEFNHGRRHRRVDEATEKYTNAIVSAKYKFM